MASGQEKTISADRIRKENQELRDSLKRKDRELRVEEALDRIRSRSMLMKHSDEIISVSEIFHKQLLELGIPSEFSYVWLPDEANHTHQFWASWSVEEDIFQGKQVTYPLDKSEPYTAACFTAWETPDIILEEFISPNEIVGFFDVWSELLEGAENLKAENFPEGIYYSEAYMKYGCFGINIRRKLSNQEKQVLRRFSIEFERAYTRFLDLQKAEVQTREAKIETALEKVRSRTMAMQSSDELPEVANIMFLEVQSLGIPAWSCGYCILLEDGRSSTCIMSSEGTLQKPFLLPHYGEVSFEEWDAFIKSDNEFFTQELKDEAILSHYDFMKSLPQLGPVFQDLQDAGLSLPDYQINHLCKFDQGFLLFITYEKVPDAHIIFQRFTAVFNQTYTRFLDLQKVEAQAREAQIQLALERVRAKTMAMKSQSDLLGIIELFGQQLSEVNVRFADVTFIEGPITKKRDWDLWSHFPGTDRLTHKVHIPYIDTPYFTKTAKFVEDYEKTGNPIQTKFFTKEEKDEFLDHYWKYAPAVPEKVKELVYANPGSTIVDAFLENVTVSIVRWDLEPFTKEELEIFERFAKEFKQTYTRYLDIKKAEAQAREAQIQLALERVRAQTMAMHSSKDLEKSAEIVFEELDKLNLNMERCGIGIFDADTLDCQLYTTVQNDDGVRELATGVTSLTIHPMLVATVDSWKMKTPLSYTLEGSELEAYYKIIRKGRFPLSEELIDKSAGLPREFYYYTPIAAGGLYFFSDTKPREEDRNIMTRFAEVFDMTYTRFLDLQKAEAQAREAKIETALEKVRSRTMGMQKSDELADVANILFEEMNGLVHNLWTCGFVLCEKDRTEDEWWLGLDDGFTRGFFLPNVSDYAHAHLYEGWLKGEAFRTVQLEGDDLQEHYDWLMKIPVAKKIFDDMEAAGMQRPEWQKLHAAYFSKGYLVIITREPCYEESIFKRFAQVFDLTYTRFLDLQKAEAQAREAQIEVALERVRSKAMAMHNSDDLAQTVDVFFHEIKSLNVSPRRCGVTLINKESTLANVALTSATDDGEDVKLIGQFDLSGHPVFDEVYRHWEIQEEYHPILKGEELRDYYQFMNPQLEYPVFPEDNIQFGHYFYFEEGVVFAWTDQEFSNEDLEIFRKFKSVLSLTYRRYLDLKEAEVQARESQIELSLERIRARVTAMQESSDLLEIVVSMRSEFVNLGHEAHYFWHMRWNPETYSKAMTSGDGSQIGMVMTLPRYIHGDIPAVAEWEKGSDPVHVLAMETETAVDYVDKMIKLGDFERVDPQAPTLDDIRHIGGLTFIMARTTHGEIGYSLPGVVPDPPKDALETLIRFAKVFDLAYKRFEDLKAAEKDLIEIKAARQKAEAALSELKSTQTQLVQQEKLASLGQLTAGIAHEIKNPLNFVNNFSEVSLELIDEALNEIKKIKDNDHAKEASEILSDVQFNLKKIHEHGTRANGIVSSMLQHSRGGSGKMEPTDLNALIQEYVNLSFHGMRAGKNPINVDIQLDLDKEIGQVNLIGEDFSRVILNLCNNAFDAMRGKAKTATDYLPILSVKTQLAANSRLLIAISDNGPGIPDEIRDKILQPFFTTKKGTEGTGLGLSITNDIVKAHGGELKVKSSKNEGSVFFFNIPINA